MGSFFTTSYFQHWLNKTILRNKSKPGEEKGKKNNNQAFLYSYSKGNTPKLEINCFLKLKHVTVIIKKSNFDENKKNYGYLSMSE